MSRTHANIGGLTVIFGCGEVDNDLRDFLTHSSSTLPFNVQLGKKNLLMLFLFILFYLIVNYDLHFDFKLFDF